MYEVYRRAICVEEKGETGCEYMIYTFDFPKVTLNLMSTVKKFGVGTINGMQTRAALRDQIFSVFAEIGLMEEKFGIKKLKRPL